MDRQHSAPVLLTVDGRSVALALEPFKGAESTLLESEIQNLVHAHPEALPIAEIDPIFVGAVSICREMQLGSAGRVDNFLMTPSGLPVLVECKLWRNPEARREVIGQILDYAKILSRWTFSDLQREVGIRTKGGKDALLNLVKQADSSIDESHFTDSVSANLRRGRFLLIILGDGVREDVETIASYIQGHAGLHFTFGLVEFPIYGLPNGERLVAPRVVARTTSIVRNVIAVPIDHVVQEASEIAEEADGEIDLERAALNASRKMFWTEFLSDYLRLDDRTQDLPKPSKLGYLSFMFPAPQGSSWLTVYRDLQAGEVGVFLSASRTSPGENAMNTVIANWQNVSGMLKGTARLTIDKYQRQRIIDSLVVGNISDPAARKIAFDWLAERVNTFVNVLRPLVREAVLDQTGRTD